MSPTLVFSHANGFPAGTYRQLFADWARAGVRVLAPDKLGHDPAFPVINGWRPSRDELVRFIERSGAVAPVHLVGHSLGGYLSLMVACRRPDLVASVTMIDSPVLGGWRAHSLQVIRTMGLLGHVSPGRVSQGRRHHWPDRDALQRHFAGKHVFARWDPGVLQDYLTAGFEPDPAGGLRLAFRREVETRFYNSLPHDLARVLHRHPPVCPVSFIAATQSQELRQVGLAATRQLVRDRLVWLEGSHLVPMERPQQTAQAVLQLAGLATAAEPGAAAA